MGRAVTNNKKSKQVDNKLQDILDLQVTDIVEQNKEQPPKVDNKLAPSGQTKYRIYDNSNQILDDDYVNAKKRLQRILQTGQEALHGMLGLAQETQSARGYQVVANLVKTMTQANRELIDMHDKRLSIEKKKMQVGDVNTKGSSGTTNIDKAIFVGTTQDLLKQIQEQKKYK